MEIKKKGTNGITLIALVITIIVLLILAGVAIATLTGDNGILTQSQKAKYVNIYKGAEEQVQLATMAVKAEIAGQKAKLGTYNATGADSINALKAIVASDLVSTGSGFEVADPEETTAGTKQIKIRYSNTALKASGISDGVPAQTGHVNYIITVTAGDATLEVNKTDNDFGDFTAGTGNGGNGGQNEEPEEPETPAASPTATFGDANTTYKDYFGKIVTGYTPTGGGTWRLFYADDNYAYLIRDSIGTFSYGDLPGYGTSTIGILAQNFNPKFTSWTAQAENTNIKVVAALMDTSNWTNYKEQGVAEWAIGAPTVEMFIKSYNATHSSATISTLYSRVESSSSVGYQVSTDNSTWDGYVEGLGYSSDLDKSIYCGYDEHGYWLASPSFQDDIDVMCVLNSGYLSYDLPYAYGAESVRPLVSVPLSKIGLESENKTLTITNDYFMSTAN